MAQQAKQLYEFGPYRIDSERRLLLRGGESVPLPSKAFDTLLVLVEHKSEVISKEDLMKALWPDSFVEESNLSQNIFVLRKALGETPQDHQYIVTIPGKGYRFVGNVREVGTNETGLVVESPSRSPIMVDEGLRSNRIDRVFSQIRRRRNRFLLLACVALGAIVGSVLLLRARRPPMHESDLLFQSEQGRAKHLLAQSFKNLQQFWASENRLPAAGRNPLPLRQTLAGRLDFLCYGQCFGEPTFPRFVELQDKRPSFSVRAQDSPNSRSFYSVNSGQIFRRAEGTVLQYSELQEICSSQHGLPVPHAIPTVTALCVLVLQSFEVQGRPEVEVLSSLRQVE